jgi:CRP-like cAMP-binding protein
MSALPASQHSVGNHLLQLLFSEDFKTVSTMLEPVQLQIKQVIHDREKPIAYIYFPCTAAISAITHMRDGTSVEVGTVGNEGVSAVEILTGADAALNTYICQIAGDSLRMTSTDFHRAMEMVPALRKVVQTYFQSYMAQMIQSVACNRLHSIELRFARWLLMTQDRARCDEFFLAQEFMAQMLGVHRPSVSAVASAFQGKGVIEYNRGHMKILDRNGLEGLSCECYFNVRDDFKRRLGIQYG